MKPYTSNIQDKTISNNNFREVLYTGNHLQLVVMSLLPGEEIGMEVHEEVDQFFRIEEGEAKVITDGNEQIIKDDFVLIVPAGTEHNIINNSDSDPLKLYTIYAPPNHPDGTVHSTKEEAEEYEKSHHHD